MELQVTGQAQLRALGAHIRAVGDKGLGRELSAALRKAARPMVAAIDEEFTGVLPRGGGYQEVASKSVRHRSSLRTGPRQGFLRIDTYAVGKAQRRDIRRLNQGELRHPRFGHRSGTWYTTEIKPRFHQRAVDRTAAGVEREMVTVAEDYAKRLLGR